VPAIASEFDILGEETPKTYYYDDASVLSKATRSELSKRLSFLEVCVISPLTLSYFHTCADVSEHIIIVSSRQPPDGSRHLCLGSATPVLQHHTLNLPLYSLTSQCDVGHVAEPDTDRLGHDAALLLLQTTTGYRIEVVTVRKLEFETDAFAFADKVRCQGGGECKCKCRRRQQQQQQQATQQ
jgi:hypothetical protein